MITVAIPLADATPHNAIELRYSLRSLEAVYGKFQLVIIGRTKSAMSVLKKHSYALFSMPDYMPSAAEKENNIRRKFYFACEVIGSPFLWSNDDFFLMPSWDDSRPKNKGPMNFTYRKSNSPGYKQSILNTQKYIGHDWIDFDNHAPCWVDPAAVKVVNQWPQYGYLHKTLYHYHAGTKNEVFCEDIKLHTRPDAKTIAKIETAQYFSTSHAALSKPFLKWLDERWPHKSRFEL